MSDRPSRHGLPLPEKLANARQERDEKAADEHEAQSQAMDAVLALSRAIAQHDRPVADAWYKAFVVQYGAWQAAHSALAQITVLTESYARQVAESSDA